MPMRPQCGRHTLHLNYHLPGHFGSKIGFVRSSIAYQNVVRHRVNLDPSQTGNLLGNGLTEPFHISRTKSRWGITTFRLYCFSAKWWWAKRPARPRRGWGAALNWNQGVGWVGARARISGSGGFNHCCILSLQQARGCFVTIGCPSSNDPTGSTAICARRPHWVLCHQHRWSKRRWRRVNGRPSRVDAQ
jgi:hypothetical protein